jgi:hypothetical protein
MIAATTDSKGNELVGRLDGATKAALGRLVNDVGCQELSLREAHPMIITRLIACGGEANTFPKHFAYFLPEDEGVDGAAKKKTIAFANVYRARFEQMSSRLGRDLLDPIPWLASSASSPMLLTWLRGHDIGHELVTPDTAYDCWAETFGVEPFMMLQEAVADVFGVLLALTPEWREAGGYSEEEMCSVFLAELLQYLRRGPWLYGDAGAAALELNFLATNGFLDVSPRSRRIRWKPEVLQDGLRALAQLLEREVISAPDGDSPRTLIERHGWHSPQCAAAQVFDTLHKELGHVPSSLAYCDQG